MPPFRTKRGTPNCWKLQVTPYLPTSHFSHASQLSPNALPWFDNRIQEIYQSPSQRSQSLYRRTRSVGGSRAHTFRRTLDTKNPASPADKASIGATPCAPQQTPPIRNALQPRRFPRRGWQPDRFFATCLAGSKVNQSDNEAKRRSAECLRGEAQTR